MLSNILKLGIKLLSVIVIFTSIFSSISAETKSAEIKINLKDKKEITSLLDKVNKSDPTKPEKNKLNKDNLNKELFSSNQGHLNISFDLKNKKINLKNQKKGDTVIGIPNETEIDSVDIVDDTIIYTGKNSKVDMIIETISGGFRQIINIKSSDAPNTYDFPIELQQGENLVANKDGSVVLTKGDGEKKFYIPKPWAKDSLGQDLNTYYQITQSGIKQIIDTKNAVFPVLADPLWCGDFFYSNYWEDRPSEGGKTLRNFPTWCGRTFDTGYGFDEIISKAPSDNAWPSYNRNYTSNQGRSMYNQYRCHVWFASLYKSSYNIEPSRPLVDWRTMVTRNFPYACNP